MTQELSPKPTRIKAGDRVISPAGRKGTVLHTNVKPAGCRVRWDNGYEGSHGPHSGLKKCEE